jgi:hypothetical protein
MIRDNERWIIGLEFGRKKNIKIIIIQADSSHDNSFNYRAKLAQIKLTQVKLAQSPN